jgi:nucleotide-binding universal stress UspA family protein
MAPASGVSRLRARKGGLVVKSILIATDGSDGARAAVSEGLELARREGADVTFVSVHDAPPAFLGDPFHGRALNHDLAAARAAIASAFEQARAAGVSADTEILQGDAAEQVARLAEIRQADLVVVGSRGRVPVARALLGSVSADVLKRCRRPVLVASHVASERRISAA